MFEDYLFLIPARGGSKGIPKKNIKPLNNKPLIYYTLDIIKDIVPYDNICVSTDAKDVIEIVEDYGIKVPFVRPAKFATDNSSTQEVIDHAIDFYKMQNRFFKGLVLLQPTSPLRTQRHLLEAMSLFDDGTGLIVSVKITSANPYYLLYEENEFGYLEQSKKGNFTRRQDCPVVYERNGAIYIYNLCKTTAEIFRYQKKYIMDEFSSIDIDNEFDWMFAEFLLSKGFVR